MTSDHVEMLLDAQRVLDGNTQVFFPNNGGREPLHMYLMALLSLVPGLGMDFTTLKLLTALEGIITLPILWWMGRELVGRESPKLGNTVGLILALLVAVSHWHVALSRLALRIALTPPITAVILVYLARGMRFNRRDDWLKAGLALGAGLYMYQAVRMLPVVIIAGSGYRRHRPRPPPRRPVALRGQLYVAGDRVVRGVRAHVRLLRAIQRPVLAAHRRPPAR